jgi:hypothetical protein
VGPPPQGGDSGDRDAGGEGVIGRIAWELLGDEELAEVAGDGTCTHLPHVRMALELQGHRTVFAELRGLLGRMPGSDDLRGKTASADDVSSGKHHCCGWCFVALGPSREAVEAHLVECKLNPLVARLCALTRELESRGDDLHRWKLVSPAEEDDSTESETHCCEVCGLQRLSEWGTLPTFYRKTSSRWERVEYSGCLTHSVGTRYQAASEAGQGCSHPELELRGHDDDWSIACSRCEKRWCPEVFACGALRDGGPS